MSPKPGRSAKATRRARLRRPLPVPLASVTLPPGSHSLGPDDGVLLVRTTREGVAARVGHDLTIEVTRWEAVVDLAAEPAPATIALTADPRSLEVREGVGGVKPLTDGDRAEIRRNIDEKVLGGKPIAFRSTRVRLPDGPGPIVVEGDLTMAGTTRPVTARLDAGDDGRARGRATLAQSDWGIRPYRGLMGALKVRDEIEIEIDVRLPVPVAARQRDPRGATTPGMSASPPLCPTCGQPASEALGGPEHDWECRNEACSEFGQPVRADEPPRRDEPDPTGP
jgi:polyisoprenoid-binding protein YceI